MTQATRSAVPTIKGYIYQFERTALALLNTPAGGDKVTVEGIEDLDVVTADGAEVIQCKYHPSQKYYLKGIRDAVFPMLKTFATRKDLQYTLYVYYSDDSQEPPPSLTVDQLKECLTKDSSKTGLVHLYEGYEDHLQGFVEVFRIIQGMEIEAQRLKLKEDLRRALHCSAEDVEDLHYDRCLGEIIRLAQAGTIDRRTTDRDRFLDVVQRKIVLFDRWQQEFLGKERILNKRLKYIKKKRLWGPRNSILVILAVHEASIWGSVLEDLAGRMRPNSGNLISNRPITVAVRAEERVTSELKIGLLSSGVRINDGHEDLGFFAEHFDAEAVKNFNGQNRHISDASFWLRCANLISLEANAFDLVRWDLILSFGVDIPAVLQAKSSCSVLVPVSEKFEVVDFLKEL